MCEECLRTGGTPGSTSISVAERAGPGTITTESPRVAPADHAVAAPYHTTRSDVDRTATPQPEGDTKQFRLQDGYLPEPPPGYDLIRCLGSGGMGSVYLAYEHAPERFVAIKFLHSPTSGTAFDRFLIEVRVLSQLRHANIINVITVEPKWREPFFTMDYASGGTIADLTRNGEKVDPREAARLIRDAATAVAAAHEKNILHRDLKPSNILLFRASAEGEFIPRVSDFGLAKVMDDDNDLTRTGPLGTPCFMSPEAAAGRTKELTAAADVYGLGATLFHLLAGRPPFTGDANDEIIQKVLKEEPPRLRTLRADVPAELEAIVVKSLEKDPARRYASAREFAEDLDRFLAGNATAAPVQTPLRRSRRWLARNRSRVAMAVGGLLVVAGLVGLVWDLTRPPKDPNEVALAEIQKDLAAGKPVTLLGATGTPRYARWQLGSAAFGKARNREDACYYATIHTNLLELLSDPGIDRYRISAMICQVERDGEPAGSKPSAGEVDCGVYFSHGFTRGLDGATSSDTMYCVRFRDFDPALTATEGEPKPPAPAKAVAPKQQSARFDWLSILHTPNNNPMHFPSNFASVEFTPTPGRPGVWRQIDVEVTPDDVRVFWKALEGNEFQEIRRTKGRLTNPKERFANAPFGADPRIVVPPWSPRMAFGIYTRSCAVAIKNITISPLRPSPE